MSLRMASGCEAISISSVEVTVSVDRVWRDVDSAEPERAVCLSRWSVTPLSERFELVDAGVPALEVAHLFMAVSRRFVGVHDGGDVARAFAFVGHRNDGCECEPGRGGSPAFGQLRREHDPGLRDDLQKATWVCRCCLRRGPA